MPVVCLAIIGQQNNPLYIKTFPAPDAERDLKLHFIVHCSLDAVEDKVLFKRLPGEVPDAYLGLLYPTEEYRAYGYLSNTGTKFTAVVDDASLKDEPMNRVLRSLHSLYIDAFCNPFFTLPIKSSKFDTQVEQVVAAVGQGLQR